MRVLHALGLLIFFSIYSDAAIIWSSPPWDPDCRWCGWNAPAYIARREHLAIVPDPAGSGANVLRIAYTKGVTGPTQTSGVSFNCPVPIPPADRYTLSYEIYFPENFDFVKGGKIPGFYGGTGSCSGCVGPTNDCFSTRFMWRTNGDVEVYLYAPESQPADLCDRANIVCNWRCGHSLGRGTLRFQRGQWHTLTQYIQLSGPNQHNGVIKMWLDGVLAFQITDINTRAKDSIGVEQIFFSTFFGGSGSEYAPPEDTTIFFRRFWVTNDNGPMELSREIN